jgi:HTH-type transcriptional regulator/antitoxin HigA
MSTALREEMRDRLGELVRQFPPVHIDDQEQLDATQAVVDDLLGRERDDAEELFLDLLGSRIREWEEEHELLPDISGTELIRALLNERGIPQRDLVEAGVFPTESIASEVLSGRRALRLEHITRVARYFRVPPEAFLPSEFEPA